MLPLLWGASSQGLIVAQALHRFLEGEGATTRVVENPDDIPPEAEVLIVDDVLYTGRTVLTRMIDLSVRFFPSRIEVAVLVDRGHRSFPIVPDYVGLRLATTLQEYVEVRFAESGWEVWLV
ncbi:MAG: phosphoribosyltransferase family protein [Bacteroidia bacterium]|nr:phosphoribosyltransferase family protein [Bacteroidia bacterium]